MISTRNCFVMLISALLGALELCVSCRMRGVQAQLIPQVVDPVGTVVEPMRYRLGGTRIAEFPLLPKATIVDDTLFVLGPHASEQGFVSLHEPLISGDIHHGTVSAPRTMVDGDSDAWFIETLPYLHVSGYDRPFLVSKDKFGKEIVEVHRSGFFLPPIPGDTTGDLHLAFRNRLYRSNGTVIDLESLGEQIAPLVLDYGCPWLTDPDTIVFPAFITDSTSTPEITFAVFALSSSGKATLQQLIPARAPYNRTYYHAAEGFLCGLSYPVLVDNHGSRMIDLGPIMGIHVTEKDPSFNNSNFIHLGILVVLGKCYMLYANNGLSTRVFYDVIDLNGKRLEQHTELLGHKDFRTLAMADKRTVFGLSPEGDSLLRWDLNAEPFKDH
jgi:hypothetical protein